MRNHLRQTPSNCGKTNVLINLLESPHGICFENVYSKSLQQPKYQYLENLLAPKEIGYFTFSNNNVLLPNEALKFHFCLQWRDMRQARHNQRVLCDGLTRVDVDCFYLCQICKDIEVSYNANLLKQNGINLKHVY